jgi:hypothetical protein
MVYMSLVCFWLIEVVHTPTDKHNDTIGSTNSWLKYVVWGKPNRERHNKVFLGVWISTRPYVSVEELGVSTHGQSLVGLLSTTILAPLHDLFLIETKDHSPHKLYCNTSHICFLLMTPSHLGAKLQEWQQHNQIAQHSHKMLERWIWTT